MPVSRSSSRPFLSVVMPAFNEAGKLAKDLGILFDYFEAQPYTTEVILVDDGSTDGTLDVLSGLRGVPGLRVLSYTPNRGKGHAVRTGVLASRGAFVLFADAGTCVPYRDIERGFALMEEGCDVALGSRGLAASRVLVRQPAYRQVGSRIFGFVVRAGFGIADIQDTQCGFKLFRRDVARDLFSAQRIDGFMFDVELIVNARRFGYSVREFPVTWSNDPDTRFKPLSGSVRNLRELLRIKLGTLDAVRRRELAAPCEVRASLTLR
jgi:glycosyltransferase involved in cell wall biosynthesis